MNEAKLPKTQAKALKILIVNGGELEDSVWHYAFGANMNATRALVRKGLVSIRRIDGVGEHGADRYFYTLVEGK